MDIILICSEKLTTFVKIFLLHLRLFKFQWYDHLIVRYSSTKYTSVICQKRHQKLKNSLKVHDETSSLKLLCSSCLLWANLICSVVLLGTFTKSYFHLIIQMHCRIVHHELSIAQYEANIRQALQLTQRLF